ncbi:MAG: dihydrodipicolinate synthase family protein [Nanoarchaeota archaeon]|nr:dihydrodipicolinate synthase family protein [Nanoarchaeota archaeon]MBU1974193.1 dihydrodipicolinate synthase family protein [Nanoarchaeota archaeon]
MYSGIIPPLVTPIDHNGNVCEQSVKNLVDFVRPYSTALMPTLSSGEGWALNNQQWEDMIKFTIKHSSGLPVLAGVEYKTTEEVVEKARKAQRLSVDAIVVTTPFEKDISQDEIYQHFEQIKKVGVPVFIYNEEAISGNSIESETIERICRLGNIVGIKEASGSADFTKRLVDSGLEIPVFQGWEHLCYQSEGVEGYIVPLANLEPRVCLEMLRNPTAEKQNEIDSLCKRYNILGEDWYVFLKKELKQRGTITTERAI